MAMHSVPQSCLPTFAGLLCLRPRLFYMDIFRLHAGYFAKLDRVIGKNSWPA